LVDRFRQNPKHFSGELRPLLVIRRLHWAAWLEVFATLSARDRGRYRGVVPLEALRQFRREILDLAALPRATARAMCACLGQSRAAMIEPTATSISSSTSNPGRRCWM